MARSRYRIYDNQSPHFLTCTLVNWLPLFTKPEVVDIVYKSWKFLQKHDRMIIYAYVIMENHLHLVASAPNLVKEIGDFKSYTARRIIDHLRETNSSGLLMLLAKSKAKHKADRNYQVWQEGSHPQVILGDEMMF